LDSTPGHVTQATGLPVLPGDGRLTLSMCTGDESRHQATPWSQDLLAPVRRTPTDCHACGAGAAGGAFEM